MQPDRDNGTDFDEPQLPMPGQDTPAEDAPREQPAEGDREQEAPAVDEPTA